MIKKLLAGLLAVGLLVSLILPFTQVSASPAFTARTETYVDVGSIIDPFTVTVAKPTGTVNGDILFCWIGWWWPAAITIDSVPAGWSLLGEYVANFDKYALYYKIADDEGANWDWSFSASAKVRIVCSSYTSGDFDAADPIDVVSNTAYRTDNDSCRAASMNVSAVNSPLIFWGGISWNGLITFTKPTVPADEWVEDDDAGGVDSDFNTEVCSMIWSGSGATGNMIATLSVAAISKHAFAVAFNPPVPAPDPPADFVASDNLNDRVTCTWTKSVGATKYQVYRDGAPIGGELGDVDTFDDMTAGVPTITPGNAVASDGTSTAHIALNIDGESANDGTLYSYKVRAGNAAGWSGDSNLDNGKRVPGALTYQWWRSAADSDAGYGVLGGATTEAHNDATAPAGTVTPGVASASDGTSTLHSVLSLAGEGINDGAGRWYYCVLDATGCAQQTTGHNRGFRRPINLTYQWYRSVADVDGGYVLTGGATTDPYNDAGFPANGDGRWVYCEVNATGAVAQDSTHDRGFRAVAPTVTTIACSGFGRDWAIVNATVDTVGLPASVTEVGFDYGLTTAYGSSQTKTGTWVAGDEFWMKLTGLTPGTVYHYRAKAFNGVWGTGGDAVFSTEGSPTLYEYLNTLGDADGTDIYAGNWSYMQFTVGTVAHSADFANIYVIRTGATPGDAVLSIRHADVANKPTGTDLDIMTLDADLFSVALDWVKFDFPDNITLEAGESYALVLRCPNGTVANYLEWRWDAGGSLANAIAGKTTDSGITWTAEGTADHLFEVWGEPVFEVVGAKVFTGYRETGDWLVVFTYRNYFTPYYMTTICRDNFYVRLLDDTTMIAQIGCPAWGYRPGSFYFSKALADAMEWGVTDYKVRLYGDFGANPYSDYNIAAADWGGAVDPFLDAWVIQEATIIGDDLGIALTETIADKGEVLNALGHIWFSIGIPYLNEVRPELFEQVSQKPPYEEEDYTHALQEETVWTTRVGAQIAATLTTAGGLFGLDGDDFGGILFVIAFLGVAGLLTLGGHLVIGLGVGYPILLAGAWFGLLSWVIVGVITFLAVAIFVYKVWLTK